MTRERRIVLVLVASLAIIVATAAWVAWSVVAGDRDLASRTEAALNRVETFDNAQTDVDVDEQSPQDLAFQEPDDDPTGIELAAGDVVAINRVPGGDYGRLIVLSPNGDRTLLDKTCERFHISGATALCLDGPQLGGRYSMEIRDFSEPTLPLLWAGTSTLPSRARVSADQNWASSTIFLEGSGYQDLGGFSTVVWVVDLASGGSAIAIDAMVIENAEARHRDPAANFWGVSFGEDGNFWVTGSFGDQVELLQGNAGDETLQPTGIEGSCPSLSPDGSTLVYKRLLDSGEYQLVAMDLASGDSWDLGESRPVDDQVEWLDENTILYGMHVEGWTGGSVDPEFDTWMVDVDPGSQPELFAPQADSPAAVR